jgi:hypothetical protein
MSIQWRPMRPKDVRGCVEIVASHPVVGSRYGAAIQQLAKVWLNLIGQEAFRAIVFEEVTVRSTRLLGAGVSAFLRDDFFQQLKTPPVPWIGSALTERIVSGSSSLLSNKEIREANADGGLNLVVWEGIVRPEDFLRPEVNMAAVNAFVEQHRGFLLKEVISQTINSEQLTSSLNGGAMFLNSDGSYTSVLPDQPEALVAQPHFIGITRELAFSHPGTWLGSLFIYQSPQFDFRPSEQRLLLTALRGGTDEELSDDLGISLSAVKKTWGLIYERAAEHLPGFSSNHNGSTNGASERGKEKKQRLLTYLRDHPEEMRPASL